MTLPLFQVSTSLRLNLHVFVLLGIIMNIILQFLTCLSQYAICITHWIHIFDIPLCLLSPCDVIINHDVDLYFIENDSLKPDYSLCISNI